MTGNPRSEVAFCPHCGSPTVQRPMYGRDRPVCTGCGQVHFAVTPNAAAALIVHQRRLLLIRRAIEPYRGCWGFPGGFQEAGEPLAETAARETREETGLTVRIERPLFVGLTRDDPRKLVNVVVFLARPDPDAGGELDESLVAADDALDVRFFGWHDLPERIAFENNQFVLEMMRRNHPDGNI